MFYSIKNTTLTPQSAAIIIEAIVPSCIVDIIKLTTQLRMSLSFSV